MYVDIYDIYVYINIYLYIYYIYIFIKKGKVYQKFSKIKHT